MRQRDERSTRVLEHDSRELPTGDRQAIDAELAMHRAEVAGLALEEDARAGRPHAEHRRRTLGERSAGREHGLAAPRKMHCQPLVRRPFDRD